MNDLLGDGCVARQHDGDAAVTLILRDAGGDAFNVESAPSEKPGDALQYPRTVIGKQRNDLFVFHDGCSFCM